VAPRTSPRAFTDPSAIAETVTDLREIVDIAGSGHWVQRERPDEVNAALLRFFRQL
jgi:pimeloyl-ACP methyl ester carboxylesterase